MFLTADNRDSKEAAMRKNEVFNNNSAHGRAPPTEQRYSNGDGSSLEVESNKLEQAKSEADDETEDVQKAVKYRAVSSMYAFLLTVLGFAMSLSIVMTVESSRYVYEAYYVYLYTGTFVFLIYVYTFLLREDLKAISKEKTPASGDGLPLQKTRYKQAPRHAGNLYLRLGGVVFGVGAMVFSGLQFGVFFILEKKQECDFVLAAVEPSFHIIFTFFQLYFIFNNSKMCINKFKTIARFGLMHMIGANLCVWVRYLVKETVEELHEVMSQEDTPKRTKHMYIPDNCVRVQSYLETTQLADKFLTPCVIEYSLVVAGIVFVMWQNIGRGSHPATSGGSTSIKDIKVDCSGVIVGMVAGIVLVVCTIAEIVLFFAMHTEGENAGLTKIIISDAYQSVVYLLSLVVGIVAFRKVSTLCFLKEVEEELDAILLTVSQLGVFLYSMFSLISTELILTLPSNGMLFARSLLTVVQTVQQTTLILDGSRRYSKEKVEEKPGRQLITFLLFANLSMWLLNTFESLKVEANPIQEEFYGIRTWTIISHFCTPLAIFYRFHSSVCLVEMWKRAYKPLKKE